MDPMRANDTKDAQHDGEQAAKQRGGAGGAGGPPPDAHAPGEGKRTYPFRVDGKTFRSDVGVLTGAQIKVLAGVDPSWGLFVEGQGGAPNRQIGDAEHVDLSVPHQKDFFSMPGATYGGGRVRGAMGGRP